MPTIGRFEDLEIWQLARNFATEIYRSYSRSEPFQKDYRLKDQINGSSASIMDNIAEGFERSGRKEFIQFLSIAKGSAGEVKSQLYRAFDRNYVSQRDFDVLYKMADEISKKLGGFINYLKKSTFDGSKFKKGSDL